MTYDRFEDLPVWNASVVLGVRVYEMTQREEFVGYASLRDQIERAAVSISNNIAEGFERGTTQELLTFLYYARGSAGEVRSMPSLLSQMPRFQNLKFEISDLKLLAENISRQLRGWADALQNSKIKGQRHLTEETRRADESARRREEFLKKLRQVRDGARGGPPSGPGAAESPEDDEESP